MAECPHFLTSTDARTGTVTCQQCRKTRSVEAVLACPRCGTQRRVGDRLVGGVLEVKCVQCQTWSATSVAKPSERVTWV